MTVWRLSPLMLVLMRVALVTDAAKLAQVLLTSSSVWPVLGWALAGGWSSYVLLRDVECGGPAMRRACE